MEENPNINPENVQRVYDWTRALLQGLAHYEITNELEQAAALERLAADKRAIAESGSPSISLYSQ